MECRPLCHFPVSPPEESCDFSRCPSAGGPGRAGVCADWRGAHVRAFLRFILNLKSSKPHTLLRTSFFSLNNIAWDIALRSYAESPRF